MTLILPIALLENHRVTILATTQIGASSSYQQDATSFIFNFSPQIILDLDFGEIT